MQSSLQRRCLRFIRLQHELIDQLKLCQQPVDQLSVVYIESQLLFLHCSALPSAERNPHHRSAALSDDVPDHQRTGELILEEQFQFLLFEVFFS